MLIPEHDIMNGHNNGLPGRRECASMASVSLLFLKRKGTKQDRSVLRFLMVEGVKVCSAAGREKREREGGEKDRHGRESEEERETKAGAR
jgi:hypothetical protein